MRTTLQTNADNAVPADTDAIALWNPTSVALWSLLLTPAFGAWLTMRNWERLGQPDKARQGRYWFAGMLLAVLANYAAAAAGALLGREDIVPPWWVSLFLFGVWCAFSAYPQIKHVDNHHGESYARRSWTAVILVTLAANCAMPFTTAVVAGYRAAAGY